MATPNPPKPTTRPEKHDVNVKHGGGPLPHEHDSLHREHDFDPNYNPQIPRERTVGEEQMERSEEIERMGVDNWKDSVDTRDPKDRPRQVPGVTNMDRAE